MWQLQSWPPCGTKTWRTCRELWPLDVSHICLLIEHACFCLVLVCILQPGAAIVPANRWSVSCSDKPSVVLCLCGITLAKSLDPASRFRSQLCWLFSRLARLSLAWPSLPRQVCQQSLSWALLAPWFSGMARWTCSSLAHSLQPMVPIHNCSYQLVGPRC